MCQSSGDDQYIISEAFSSDRVVKVDLPAKITEVGKYTLLQIIPAFGVRLNINDPSSRKFGVMNVSLTNPEQAQKKFQEILQKTSAGKVDSFSIYLESKSMAADLLTEKHQKHEIDLQLSLKLNGIEHKSPLVHGHLRYNKKATNRVNKNYGDDIFHFLILGGITCFPFWNYTGGFFWTKCVGFCLPFFTCKCFSPGSMQFRTFCGGWTDCECLPNFLVRFRKF